MVQIQIEVDEDTSNKIEIYRAVKKFDTKAIATSKIIQEFFEKEVKKK